MPKSRGRVALLYCAALLFFAAPLPAHADATDDVALQEIADALIDHMPDGTAYGSYLYRALPQAPDGRKIMRLYMQPDADTMAIMNRYPGLWYQLSQPHRLSDAMQVWVLEEYSREFPSLQFEITQTPAQATIYLAEGQFVPRQSGPTRPADSYQKTAANTVFLALRSRGALAFINVNSDGNPWFKQAIAQGRGAVVRATMLNEFFNAMGVRDFQAIDATKLSPATHAWLEVHRATIDDYTITRSGGPVDDEHLKPLDRLIIAKLFQ